MMNRYKFHATHLTNTLPFQVTPHLHLRVPQNNAYLPDHLRTNSGDLLSLDDSPRAAFRNGVPVVPATTLKGALRHLLTEFQTRGMSGLPIKMINYLALGGIKPKGQPEFANSPFNREIERGRFPLVSLFGASDPVFIRGAVRTFPDLVPTTPFQLMEIPIIRTDAARDDTTIRCDEDDLNAFILEQAGSSTTMKNAKKAIQDALKVRNNARKTGVGEAEAEAALNAAYRAEDDLADAAMVQSGQLHSYFAVPAGVQFSHDFRLDAEDHELGLLLIGLQEFALNGGLIGGQVSRGCGGGLDFIYEVSRLNPETNAFEEIGSISNETISGLDQYVEAYTARSDEWFHNIQNHTKLTDNKVRIAAKTKAKEG